MYTGAPALVPIFRSSAQAKILAWLLLQPDQEQTIASLTAVSDVAQPNTLRETNRLVAAGLLTDRRSGNARLVRANTESPYYKALTTILSRSFGPAIVVPQVLSGLSGVEKVVIVGSWAERYLGTPGNPPNDVDVVIVGQPDRRAVRAANRELEERLHIPVQLIVVTSPDWVAARSGFVADVLTKPHVTLMDTEIE